MASKINLAVIFGGKSAEHDISIKSAQNIIKHIDRDRCEIILIAIDRQGKWFIHENQFDFDNDLSLKGFNNEILLCLDGSGRVYNIQNQKFIKNRQIGYYNTLLYSIDCFGFHFLKKAFAVSI